MKYQHTVNAFSSGQLSKKLHGRFNIPQYREGLAEMRNVVAMKQGGARLPVGPEYLDDFDSVAGDTDIEASDKFYGELASLTGKVLEHRYMSSLGFFALGGSAREYFVGVVYYKDTVSATYSKRRTFLARNDSAIGSPHFSVSSLYFFDEDLPGIGTSTSVMEWSLGHSLVQYVSNLLVFVEKSGKHLPIAITSSGVSYFHNWPIGFPNSPASPADFEGDKIPDHSVPYYASFPYSSPLVNSPTDTALRTLPAYIITPGPTPSIMVAPGPLNRNCISTLSKYDLHTVPPPIAPSVQ